MKLQNTRRKASLVISGLSMGLLICSLPTLAQSGGDNSGSSGGTSDGIGTTQNRDTNRDSGFNPGWLGLLGLAGLMGLRRQETHEAPRARVVGQQP